MKRFAPILLSAVLLGFAVVPVMATPTPQEWDASEWGSSGDDDEPLIHTSDPTCLRPDTQLGRQALPAVDSNDRQSGPWAESRRLVRVIRDWFSGVFRPLRKE